MDSRFLAARSPVRLLEKGLHGGLGRGNLGLVLAGPGVGKSSFLVGIALDDLLRGKPVLHVTLDQSVAHVRAYYDTLFDDLASSTHLEDLARVRAETDRRRRIRAYPATAFDAKRLREAIAVESESGAPPSVVVVDGFDVTSCPRDELREWKDIARSASVELWISTASSDERIPALPTRLRDVWDLFGVILALEPGSEAVALRALKDHDNPDVSALHVSLDPKTLLLIRS
jgi:hypothetical protein